MKRKFVVVVLVLFVAFLWVLSIPARQQQAEQEQKKEQKQVRKEEPVKEVKPPATDSIQAVPDERKPPRDVPIVRYDIDARLIPDSRKVNGDLVLTWTNPSDTAVDHLRFHLYYNGFRSPETTYMKEGRMYRRSKEQIAKIKFGEIKLKEFLRVGGQDLVDKIKYIAPDDGNQEDRTVMEVPLEVPVEPGQSISLKMRFELTVPQFFRRTGMKEDYFFLGQWFPKIGVLQEGGVWNCHQFHRSSEFFADYGQYQVRITVPEKFVVGATGNLVDSEKNADGTLTYVYEEKNIHDFGWVAYPHFQRVTEKVRLKGNSHETLIELLLPPGHEAAKDRHMDSLKFTLNFFAEHVIPYPYKKITVVDPPMKGFGSGGMEYPTLITTMYSRLMPDALKLPELVTIHEFAHQYWYGIVGTDEFREAWLDEGVTSFFELEIMDAYFKSKNSASLLDSRILKVDDWERARLSYTSLLPGDKVNQYSWKFIDGSQYSSNVYSKASIFLLTLKNYVGKEKMYNFFKYYASRYKFQHPTTENFIETFNSFMNQDFTWAFDLYINGDAKLDHAVRSVESVKVQSDPVQYRNEVLFIRKQGYFPAELLIKLENGKEIKSFWKEKDKWKRMVFTDESPILYAAIDPQLKIPLDINYLDNSRRLKQDTSYIKRLSMRYGFFFQNLMSFLAF